MMIAPNSLVRQKDRAQGEKESGWVRFGAADSAPPFRRWTFRHRDHSAPELFFRFVFL